MRAALLILICTAACTKSQQPATPVAVRDAQVTTTASVAVQTGPPWALDLSKFAPPNVPDALTFHGWSADGRRYAFEYYVPAVAADCEDRFHLYVVDAETDRFVTGGALELVREQVEGDSEGKCQPTDLATLMNERRPKILAQNGIVVGNMKPPQGLEKLGNQWWITWTNGSHSKLAFDVLNATDDPYGPQAEKGASYRLAVDGKIVEPGTRRRPGVIRYELDDALVFESPNGRHAALVLERFVRGFEGARASWMSNGFIRK